MTEVLKALQELNVYWKKIGHYNMKCRWARNIPGQNETMLNLNHGFGEETGIVENDDCGTENSQNVVKFEIQVSCLFPIRKTSKIPSNGILDLHQASYVLFYLFIYLFLYL